MPLPASTTRQAAKAAAPEGSQHGPGNPPDSTTQSHSAHYRRRRAPPEEHLNRFYWWPETGIPSVASGQSSTTSSRTAAVACISPSAPQLSETPVRQPPRQASAWASARQTVVSRAPGSAVWQCCSSTGSSSPGPPATCARHGRRPGDTRDFLGRRRQPVRDPAGRLLALARLTVSRAAYGLMFWLW